MVASTSFSGAGTMLVSIGGSSRRTARPSGSRTSSTNRGRRRTRWRSQIWMATARTSWSQGSASGRTTAAILRSGSSGHLLLSLEPPVLDVHAPHDCGARREYRSCRQYSVTDLNGDGRPDLTAPSKLGLWVLLNQGYK